MKFYKRDPDAALAGMVELTLIERGAYNTILDALYSRDGHLPDDDDMLRRIMGCHKTQWKAVKSKLIEKRKIWIEGGFIKANRVDDVLSEAAEFSEKQAKRAKKRWKTVEKRSRNAEETVEKQVEKTEKAQQNQTLPDANGGNPNTPTPITEANASDPDGSAEQDLSKIVFGQGLRFLQSNGLQERHARSMLGKWRQLHGDEKLLTALGRAQREGALDPVAFVEGVFRSSRQQKGKDHDRFARKMEMATRRGGRAAADPGMADGEDRGEPVAVLPARRIG